MGEPPPPPPPPFITHKPTPNEEKTTTKSPHSVIIKNKIAKNYSFFLLTVLKTFVKDNDKKIIIIIQMFSKKNRFIWVHTTGIKKKTTNKTRERKSLRLLYFSPTQGDLGTEPIEEPEENNFGKLRRIFFEF